MNRVYWPVYCSIIEIKENTIVVKTEHNRKMEVPSDWVQDNKIERPANALPEEDQFLACPCGSMRFKFEDKKLICVDCNAEYTKEDYGLLKTTNYVPGEIKKDTTIH
jgi:hypothetical protein